MALKLTVVTTDSTIQKYELVLDQPEITVGRSAACHIQLPFSTISSHHFTIVREGRSHLIVDQDSTNGTRLGDKILAPAHYTALKDGDKIVLTGVEINVAILTEPVDVMDAARTGEAVRAMVFEMLRHSGELDDTAAWIEVLEGPDKGRRKRLPSGGQGDLSVGSEGADWILSDEGLSTPLQFEVRAESFFIRPPDNPGAVLLIDGKPLSGSTPRPLRSGTRLHIAQTTLLFVDPLQTYLDQLEDPPEDDEDDAPISTSSTHEMKGILLPDSLPKPDPRAPRMTPPAGQPRTGTQRVRRDEIAHTAHTRAGLPLGKGREPALAVAGREEGEALESQSNRWHDGWSTGELMMIVFIVVFLVGAAFTFAVVFGLLDR